MQAFYCDHFVLPLPTGHRFPMEKYRLLREAVERELPQVELHEPPAATDGQLALAHHPDYLKRFFAGQLTELEQRRIGFPWSAAMAERSRRSVGATIAACRSALQSGAASANLAGGTHHAYGDRGEGYCCFNDIAVATRLMQAEYPGLKVAVIDLDVHQGNGTAAILGREDKVFLLSIHGDRNYPFRKETGHLDIALPDGTTDEAYLCALDNALDHISEKLKPDFVLYIAGADIYEGDRLGKLSISQAGCAKRDETVLNFARTFQAPIVATMGGGYCPRIEETVAIHFHSIRALSKYQL